MQNFKNNYREDKCIFPLEREVNQILWFDTLGKDEYGENGNDFKNDTFEVKSYSWDDTDEGANEYHFHHYASNLKIAWYKYPLRSPTTNMLVTHEQFLAVLRDCLNSMNTGITYDIEKWWNEQSGR